MIYIGISEGNCDLAYIISRAREAFGVDDLVLVQSNGLRVEDNEVTRGNYYLYLLFTKKSNVYIHYLNILKINYRELDIFAVFIITTVSNIFRMSFRRMFCFVH